MQVYIHFFEMPLMVIALACLLQTGLIEYYGQKEGLLHACIAICMQGYLLVLIYRISTQFVWDQAEFKIGTQKTNMIHLLQWFIMISLVSQSAITSLSDYWCLIVVKGFFICTDIYLAIYVIKMIWIYKEITKHIKNIIDKILYRWISD